MPVLKVRKLIHQGNKSFSLFLWSLTEPRDGDTGLRSGTLFTLYQPTSQYSWGLEGQAATRHGSVPGTVTHRASVEFVATSFSVTFFSLKISGGWGIEAGCSCRSKNPRVGQQMGHQSRSRTVDPVHAF